MVTWLFAISISLSHLRPRHRHLLFHGRQVVLDRIPSTTLAVYVRGLCRWVSHNTDMPGEEVENGLTNGRHARLWRRSPDSFFSAPQLW